MILLINLPCLHSQPTYDDIQYFQEADKAVWNWKWVTSWYNRAMSRATITATFAFCAPGWQLPVFHVTHTLLHFVNSLLVWGIAGTILDPVSAGVAMLLFAVSPLAVPAVSMIATRSAILASVFVFSAIWLTLAGHPIVALGMVIPAIYAREDSVVLIPLIALLAPGSAKYVLGIPFLISLGMMKQIVYVVRHRILNNGSIGMAAAGMNESLDQPDYTITAMVENLWRWPFWNIGLMQNHDPKIDAVPRFRVAAPLMTIVAMAAAAWLLGPVRVPVVIVLVSPLAASWFFPLPDVVSESRAYSTIAGFSLLAAMLPLPIPVFVLVVGALASVAAYRTFLHRSPIHYWLAAWRGDRPKLRVAINIGAALQNAGDMAGAMTWHNRALEISSQNGIVFANMALWQEGSARMVRREVAQDMVQVGQMEVQKVKDVHARSVAHLSEALHLMSLAVAACPNDPMVVEYARKVREHATIAGVISSYS